MNSEYFLIFFLTVSTSENSTESSFKNRVILVPLPKVSWIFSNSERRSSSRNPNML